MEAFIYTGYVAEKLKNIVGPTLTALGISALLTACTPEPTVTPTPLRPPETMSLPFDATPCEKAWATYWKDYVIPYGFNAEYDGEFFSFEPAQSGSRLGSKLEEIRLSDIYDNCDLQKVTDLNDRKGRSIIYQYVDKNGKIRWSIRGKNLFSVTF